MFKFFSWLAVTCHIIFFIIECFYLHLIIRGVAPSEISQSTLLFAFNQGFYNLFLAVGLALGLLRFSKDRAFILVVQFILITMVGAAIVLLASDFSLYRGALIQGVPPFLAIVFKPKKL